MQRMCRRYYTLLVFILEPHRGYILLGSHISILLVHSHLRWVLDKKYNYHCALLCAALRYSMLLCATLRYSVLLYATLCYSTLLYATLRYSALLCAILCYSALRCSVHNLVYSSVIKECYDGKIGHSRLTMWWGTHHIIVVNGTYIQWWHHFSQQTQKYRSREIDRYRQNHTKKNSSNGRETRCCMCVVFQTPYVWNFQTAVETISQDQKKSPNSDIMYNRKEELHRHCCK